MRHLRDFEEKNKKENYCLFIAPKFHIDTINTFWMSVRYEYQGKPQKIIPLIITQLIDILNTIVDLKKLNKNWIGIENNLEYIKLAKNRLEIKK